MQEKDFQKVINDMKETLGEENIGKIADSLGILITDNSNMNKDLVKKDDEIKILKDDKERLITTNGKLLQQVSYGTEEEIIDTGKEKEEKKKYIDYKLAFDEKRKEKSPRQHPLSALRKNNMRQMRKFLRRQTAYTQRKTRQNVYM